MTWLRNAWYRLFTWVASWGRPIVQAEAQPQLDKEAQALVALAKVVRLGEQAVASRQPMRLTYPEYLRLREEQMKEATDAPANPNRSASYSVCRRRLDEYNEAQWRATERRLSLKVEK